MKRFLLYALLLLFSHTNSYAEGLKIGAILALSGDAASLGEACRNGMELILKDLDPTLRSKVDVLFEDDSMTPKNTVSAFNKFISADDVDVVITFSSPSSKSIASLAERRKLPVIAIASDPSIVKDRDYIFNLWVTPDEEAKLLLQELKRRGIKNIARILAQHDGTLSISSAFDQINNNQIVIKLDEQYPVKVRDFRPFINKLKLVENLDAVFVELSFGQTGIFAKQMKELGSTLPLFNVETFEDPNDLKLSEGALVGHWYIQADDPGDAFLTRYKNEFPDAATMTAGNCHDAIKLLADAVANEVKTDQIKEYLQNINDFEGAMGKFSSTGDNRFSLPATVKIVTETGFKKIGS